MTHRPFALILLGLTTILFSSCGPSIDMPKGSSAKYASARLVIPPPGIQLSEKETAVHRVIHSALKQEFTRNKLSYGAANADLIVSYMVLYQEPGMTQQYATYFGGGREAGEIREIAHRKGASENKRPDFFRQAGILIDVVDAKTNELVYRNFAKGDVVPNTAQSLREARIRQAVSTALADFFRS